MAQNDLPISEVQSCLAFARPDERSQAEQYLTEYDGIGCDLESGFQHERRRFEFQFRVFRSEEQGSKVADLRPRTFHLNVFQQSSLDFRGNRSVGKRVGDGLETRISQAPERIVPEVLVSAGLTGRFGLANKFEETGNFIRRGGDFDRQAVLPEAVCDPLDL